VNYRYFIFSVLLSIITFISACNLNKDQASQGNDINKNTTVSGTKAKASAASPNTDIRPAMAEYDSFGIRVDTLSVESYQIERNESLYLILDKLDFTPQEIYSISRKAESLVDFKSFKPGQTYRVYSSDNSKKKISKLVWQPDPLKYVVFDWQKDSLNIYKSKKELKTVKRVATGVIDYSLYETMLEEDLSPLLAYKMSDIFAWQIDFFQLRSGDSFKVLYEENYVDDAFYSIGDVLAVEFIHRKNSYLAYHYTSDKEGETEQVSGFYDEKGNSVQKALLKAPFRFNQRITSGFSHNRFHPVLKRNRPHYGVDYGAPHGTPVLSVGDGRVTEAQRRGANGNIVKIRHNNVYETAYLHLSGFAKDIRNGAKVEQGQVIGYVGRTGRVTGTHLDYRVYKDGRPVNPLTLELPAAESIPDSLMDSFTETRDRYHRLFNKLLDSSEYVTI